MNETIAIANACGHHLPTALALDLMKRTKLIGDYKTSTLVDYLAGRPLEIESIWGEPLRRGEVSRGRCAAVGDALPSAAFRAIAQRGNESIGAARDFGAQSAAKNRAQSGRAGTIRGTGALLLPARTESRPWPDEPGGNRGHPHFRSQDGAIHRRFMGIAGPTDVITFQHGEIFISVETARRQAQAHRTSLAPRTAPVSRAWSPPSARIR